MSNLHNSTLMRVSTYGLVVLAILGISSPLLAFAEVENEANEDANEIETQAEHGGSDRHSGSASSEMVLFVTIAAIASVVAYSGWKVYKIRKRTTSKATV